MFQDKAQTAKNGPVLLKGCNTVLGHLGTSLRASWEVVIVHGCTGAAKGRSPRAAVRGVTPLGKDQPLPARRAFGNCSLRCSTFCIPAVVRPTTSQLAELAVITLKEHLRCSGMCIFQQFLLPADECIVFFLPL